MAKKKRPSLRKDENETAYALVQAMIGEGPRPEPPGKREKNPEAVERGRQGGKSRKDRIGAEERSAIAKRAAETRWGRESGA